MRTQAEPDLCSVLDAEPDLGASLDTQTLRAAREQAKARTAFVDVGALADPPEAPGRRRLKAILIVEGLLARAVSVGDRTSTELLGPGDVLGPRGPEESVLLPFEVRWRALAPTELALLDAEFMLRVRRWPQIGDALLERAMRRAHRLAVQGALSAHKRLDARILLLFRHLAERWGRVTHGGGVRLDLPLTHRVIGELVGAERPSVTTTLAALADLGLLTRNGQGWVLDGAALDAAADVPASLAMPI
jgi:CRP/FNR family cyclic AMP-dependent transcriptional regulator